MKRCGKRGNVSRVSHQKGGAGDKNGHSTVYNFRSYVLLFNILSLLSLKSCPNPGNWLCLTAEGISCFEPLWDPSTEHCYTDSIRLYHNNCPPRPGS